jgi:hypothetical protein
MGFQEVLIHLHPTIAVLLLPAAALVGFVALPLLGRNDGPAGRWFLTANGLRTAVGATLTAVVLTSLAVVADDAFGAAAVSPGGWIARGLVPVAALVGIISLAWTGLRRRFGADRNEALQAIVVFLFASFATLTVIGVFFRGEGMALRMPWGG